MIVPLETVISSSTPLSAVTNLTYGRFQSSAVSEISIFKDKEIDVTFPGIESPKGLKLTLVIGVPFDVHSLNKGISTFSSLFSLALISSKLLIISSFFVYFAATP